MRESHVGRQVSRAALIKKENQEGRNILVYELPVFGYWEETRLFLIL